MQKNTKKIYLTTKQKKEYAKTLIEKYWKEEAIKKIEIILNYTDNEDIQNIFWWISEIIKKNY